MREEDRRTASRPVTRRIYRDGAKEIPSSGVIMDERQEPIVPSVSIPPVVLWMQSRDSSASRGVHPALLLYPTHSIIHQTVLQMRGAERRIISGIVTVPWPFGAPGITRWNRLIVSKSLGSVATGSTIRLASTVPTRVKVNSLNPINKGAKEAVGPSITSVPAMEIQRSGARMTNYIRSHAVPNSG